MQEMLDLKLHQESMFFMWILMTILISILANDLWKQETMRMLILLSEMQLWKKKMGMS